MLTDIQMFRRECNSGSSLMLCESAEPDNRGIANWRQLAQNDVSGALIKRGEKLYFLNPSVKSSFAKRQHFHEFRLYESIDTTCVVTQCHT